MSLVKYLKEQVEGTFKRSYHTPYNQLPYLLEKLTENNPNLVVKELDDGDTIVYDKDTQEKLLHYSFEYKTMNSDYTFAQLLNYGSE